MSGNDIQQVLMQQQQDESQNLLSASPSKPRRKSHSSRGGGDSFSSLSSSSSKFSGNDQEFRRNSVSHFHSSSGSSGRNPNGSPHAKRKKKKSSTKRRLKEDGSLPSSISTNSLMPPMDYPEATMMTTSPTNSIGGEKNTSTQTTSPQPQADPFGSIFSPVTSSIAEAFNEYKFPPDPKYDDNDEDGNVGVHMNGHHMFEDQSMVDIDTMNRFDSAEEYDHHSDGDMAQDDHMYDIPEQMTGNNNNNNNGRMQQMPNYPLETFSARNESPSSVYSDQAKTPSKKSPLDSTQSMRSELMSMSSQWQKTMHDDYDDNSDDEMYNSDEEDVRFAGIRGFNAKIEEEETMSPSSPHRGLFQSISIVSVLVQQLEYSAEHTKHAEARNMLWKEWCSLLKDSENNSNAAPTYMDENYHVMTFREVFIKSRALEKVAEGVILLPDSGDTAQLWELFRLCLIGDHQDHLQLISSLKKIGSSIRGKPLSLTRPIINMALEIISQFKIKPDQQKLLLTSLGSLDKQILDKEKMLVSRDTKNPTSKTYAARAMISGELVRLCEQKRDLLLSLSQKWQSAESVKSFFDRCSEVVGVGISDKKFTNNIQNQLKQLAQVRSQTEEEYHSKFEELDGDISLLASKETQLFEFKRELELKLQQVNNDIKAVQIKRSEKTTEREMHQKTLQAILEDFKIKENELLNDIDSDTSEHSVLANLSEFVVQSRDILLTSLKKRSNGLEQLIFQSTQRYIEQVASYLEQQNQRMIDILKSKILVLCEKLNMMRKTYVELQNLGQDREARAKMKKIKLYYHQYLTAEKAAKDILLDAENINQFIHNLPYAIHYNNAIQQIDSQLTVLSDSENLMLKCNNSVQWVPAEISTYDQQCSPLSAHPVDHYSSCESDVSDVSMASVESHHSDLHIEKDRLSQIEEFLRHHQAAGLEVHTVGGGGAFPVPEQSRSRSLSNGTSPSPPRTTKLERRSSEESPRFQRRSSVSAAVPSHAQAQIPAHVLHRRSSVSAGLPSHHQQRGPTKTKRSSSGGSSKDPMFKP